MRFKNRREAGLLLAEKLTSYGGTPLVIYGLPRGGVVTAFEIAKHLKAPLDIICVRKIGHPNEPEFALGAVAEDGHLLGDQIGLAAVDQSWLAKEADRERKEAARRRETYLQGRTGLPVKNKTAILVDDGVATGYTLRLAIRELKHRHPKKIIVAVPVIPERVAALVRAEVNELTALDVPSEIDFLGAVGAYYEEFLPVNDDEVIDLLRN